MTNIGTKLMTWLSGEEVGVDEFGHHYYQEKKDIKARRRRRWVTFGGDEDASTIPPEWHAWLHYTLETIPEQEGHKKYFWQKSHVPNTTGTTKAYLPSGHVLRGGIRPTATGDYEPWEPE